MDAFFRGLVKRMSFNAEVDVSSKPQPAPVQEIAPWHAVRRTLDETESNGRVAHWDNKREKCQNCNLIYLKTLSRHPGFCSVDCKSNAAYLEKVNRTIRAVKDAVDHIQQTKQQQQEEQPVVEEQQQQQAPVVALPVPSRRPIAIVRTDAHTFAEYELESRMMDGNNVEWAFSALY